MAQTTNRSKFADLVSPELRAALPGLRESFQASLRLKSAADSVYDAVVAAIHSGELPAGTRLREVELATALGVSRTPIREALARLDAAHLGFRTPRGYIVSEITRRQILEVYQIREALDAMAARLAAQFASPMQLSEMDALNRQMNDAAERSAFSEMADLNVRFHETMAQASHNDLLIRLVRDIHHWVRRFATTTFSHPGRAPVAIAEHLAIVKAIAARDPDAAEELAKEHMRRSLDARVAMQAAEEA